LKSFVGCGNSVGSNSHVQVQTVSFSCWLGRAMMGVLPIASEKVHSWALNYVSNIKAVTHKFVINGRQLFPCGTSRCGVCFVKYARQCCILLPSLVHNVPCTVSMLFMSHSIWATQAAQAAVFPNKTWAARRLLVSHPARLPCQLRRPCCTSRRRWVRRKRIESIFLKNQCHVKLIKKESSAWHVLSSLCAQTYLFILPPWQ